MVEVNATVWGTDTKIGEICYTENPEEFIQQMSDHSFVCGVRDLELQRSFQQIKTPEIMRLNLKLQRKLPENNEISVSVAI